ncbi:MAG: hypothetical protein J5717_11490 [Lachnospiraceae bacterium]|nr:hypothetical protein [Lachnospiraceae bacterium]
MYPVSIGSTEDLLDEVFATKKEAEHAALEGENNYIVGNSTLQLGGHDYDPARIIDWDIVKE